MDDEQRLALEAMKEYASEGTPFEMAVQKMKASGWSIPDNLMGDFQTAYSGGVVTTDPVVTNPAVASVAEGAAVGTNNVMDYNKKLLSETGNKLTGDNPWLSMKGVFGDNTSTGWGMTGVNTLLAINSAFDKKDELAAIKKNNAEKLALMKEANFMKKLKMKNQVNQANRYQMLATGNSNSQTATIAATVRTPYTSMEVK